MGFLRPSGEDKTELISPRAGLPGEFRLLLDAAIGAVLVLDVDCRVIAANAEAGELWGYDWQAMAGLSLAVLLGDSYHQSETLRQWYEQEAPFEATGIRQDKSDFAFRGRTRQHTLAGKTYFTLTAHRLNPAAEVELPALPEVLASLLETDVLGFILLDRQGMVVACNRLAREYFRDTAGIEVNPGRNLFKTLPAKEKEVYEENHLSSLAGQWVQLVQTVTVSDEKQWYELNFSPVFNNRHQVLGVAVALINVTRHKQTEVALRQSEDRFRSLVQNSTDIISILDTEGRFIYLTSSFEGLTGYPADKVTGKVSLGFIHPADRELIREKFEEAAQEHGKTFFLEGRFRKADGHYLHLEILCNNQKDDPSVGGIILNARNVTERKQAELALQRSEGRFRSLVQNSNDIIAVLSRGGRVKYTSPSITRLLGFSPEEMLGRPSSDFMHPDDVARIVSIFQEASRKFGQVFTTEFRCRCADGSWVFLEAVGTNLRRDPSVNGIVVNARDVTDRHWAQETLRRSEEQLYQSQKMEAIGRLAGGVAHDFNNLMTVILGNAEILGQSLADDSFLQEDLGEIRKAAERAATLTGQLLAFGRRSMMKKEPLNLNSVVKDTEKMLRRLIGEDIELLVKLDPELWPIEADLGQIQQVIMNLAVNSRDAMPGGGTLLIETTNVELSEDYASDHVGVKAGDYAMMAFSDTGHGMSEDTINRAFEPFFTTKEPGRGTGLGLSTVYGIIKQSGGNIWVYSELGLGTTFKIYLPYARSVAPVVASHTQPENQPTPRLRGNETILLVEDDPSVRDMVLRSLRFYGYGVLVAASGYEALEICQSFEGRIDLLLTDVIMPGMNGRELAEQVRQQLPGIRLLFMSGYTDNAIIQHGLLNEEGSFLQKPFTPNELATRLRLILNS